MAGRRRVAYRVGQAVSMLRGGMSANDRTEVETILSAALLERFLLMSERDQRHAVRVMRRARRLDSRGLDREMLLQASLLHDVGKARAPLGIPGRSLAVLAGAVGASAVVRRAPLLGRRLDRYLRHPAVGARMLEEVGAAPRLVEIVEEHQRPHPVHPETVALQEVDGLE